MKSNHAAFGCFQDASGLSVRWDETSMITSLTPGHETSGVQICVPLGVVIEEDHVAGMVGKSRRLKLLVAGAGQALIDAVKPVEQLIC